MISTGLPVYVFDVGAQADAVRAALSRGHRGMVMPVPEGEPDIAAVFFAFARGRARLGDLMRLARDSNAAFASLGRCRARLGSGLGIPLPSA